MEIEKIIEHFTELLQASKDGLLEWELKGNTVYETNWNGQEIIVDRRNNIDTNSQEVYLKIGEFENIYLPDSDEFTYLVEVQDEIKWKH